MTGAHALSLEAPASHTRPNDVVRRGHRLFQVGLVEITVDQTTLHVVALVDGKPSGPETTLILPSNEIIRTLSI